MSYTSILAVVLAAAAEGTAVPVRRLYRPDTGEHRFTVDQSEVDQLMNSGWNHEGTAFLSEGDVPVFSLSSPATGEVHYTADVEEASVLKEIGWKAEGTAWYARREGADALPVYRLYNPNGERGRHHFTLSSAECNALVSFGWQYEGIAFYAEEGETLDDLTLILMDRIFTHDTVFEMHVNVLSDRDMEGSDLVFDELYERMMDLPEGEYALSMIAGGAAWFDESAYEDGILSGVLQVRLAYMPESLLYDESFRNEAEQVVENLNLAGKSEKEKARIIQSWVNNHVAYDRSCTRQTVYDAFFEGSAVCEGYARLYQYLASLAGLKSYTVTGYGTGIPHMWCISRIGEFFYCLDPTWDDTGYGSTDWFLRGTDYFYVTHSPDVTGFLEKIPLSAADYPYR